MQCLLRPLDATKIPSILDYMVTVVMGDRVEVNKPFQDGNLKLSQVLKGAREVLHQLLILVWDVAPHCESFEISKTSKVSSSQVEWQVIGKKNHKRGNLLEYSLLLHQGNSEHDDYYQGNAQ